MSNHFVTEGRLTFDPEMKKFESGKTFVEFKIAESRYIKNAKTGDTKEVTSFWLCRRYLNTEVSAQGFLRMMKKGDLVTITGSITKDDYKDDDGNWKTFVTVTAFDDKNRTQYARNLLRKANENGTLNNLLESSDNYANNYQEPVEDDLPV